MFFWTGSSRSTAASRLSFFLIAGMPLICGLSCTPSPPDWETVSFQAEDGVTLTGTVYHPGQKAAPGLILVHREGGDRSHWQGFVQRAQREGFRCITFDLRGHGESGGPDGRHWRAFTPADWMGALKDIAAAKDVLLAEETASSDIFVLGEGVGANLALRYAVTDADIPGIVLLSPGWEYAGVSIEDVAAGLERLPMLVLAAEGDGYAAGTASGLMAQAQDFREIRTYAGAAHGADIFAASQQAMEQVLHWIGILLDPADPKKDMHETS
jgi:pimeloyl-ACP methyl ester carboxylesterase